MHMNLKVKCIKETTSYCKPIRAAKNLISALLGDVEFDILAPAAEFVHQGCECLALKFGFLQDFLAR
jgi:hypothetical protein